MFDAALNNFNVERIHASYNTEAKASILIVEDDLTLNRQMTSLFIAENYSVTNTACGEQALSYLTCEEFDLAILDIEVPNVDGLSLLHYIRNNLNIPVILLTAYAAEEHRIRGLKSGADDYISKPCNFTELSLRVEAVLRRTQNPPQTQTSMLLSYRELQLNRSDHSVSVNPESSPVTVKLTPIQFKLLWTLTSNNGSLQSKPYLYQVVLERDFSKYDRTLDMHLSRVRKRLVDAGMSADRIQTIHGKGYLLK